MNKMIRLRSVAYCFAAFFATQVVVSQKVFSVFTDFRTTKNIGADTVSANHVEATTSNLVPVGTVIMWPTDVIPDGWLLCDGSAVPAGTEYDLLRNLLGGGGGAVVPDFRDYFPRGKGSSRTVLSTQADATALPNQNFISDTTGLHNHSASASTSSHTHAYHTYVNANITNNRNSRAGETGGRASTTVNSRTTSSASHSHVITIDNSGNHSHEITGGGDSETRPMNLAINFIIKY